MLDAITHTDSGRDGAPQATAAVSMVDETKLLRVVKRLFTGSVKEVLGELLQNSQRGGARNVRITADGETVRISDDGTGLTGAGKEMFSALMRIAESSYERESVAEQDPMGVGLFSLFALDGVKDVVLSSHGFSLAVDTDRLWNEEGYWQGWQSRVVEAETGENTGLEIVITATAELVKSIAACLRATGSELYYFNNGYEHKSPVCGYVGVLDVFLNDELLDNNCEFAKKMDEAYVTTEYQGNLLIIGADNFAHQNTINWYGQLIKANVSHLRYYLEVRQGRPVNPMSPSRRGIIEDEEFKKLRRFVREKLREYILNTPQEKLTTLVINTAYTSDKEWTNASCPYFTATKWQHDTSHGSYESWSGDFAEKVVLRYEDSPLLIKDSVAVAEIDAESKQLSTSEVLSCGAQSFVPVIEAVLGKEVYEISSGNAERLTVQQVWWKPGRDLEDFFVENGEFVLCDAKIDDVPETGWQSIGDRIVFAFEYPENWDICSTENLIVGVQDNIRSKLEFLNDAAWCVWSYENDDHDADTMETDFRKSLEAVKATLFTDCLPDETIELWRIQPYFKLESGERIAGLEFVYPENITNHRPIGLRLVTSAGRTMQKQFLSSAEAGLQP